MVERKKFHILSWTGALLLLGIVVLANYIVSFVPIRLDTSQGRVYSITPGTKDILKKLNDTMLVKVVFTPHLPPPYNLNEQYLSDLLREYKRASNGKIRIEYVDPGKSPKSREEAMNSGVVPVQIDVREQDRREVKECFMGATIYYGDKKESIALIQDTLNLEYEITSRIKRLIDPSKPSIGFVSSGGAMTIETKQLESMGPYLNQLYNVETVDLKQPVPEKTKALWIVAPTTNFSSNELENLRAFVKNGGFVGLLLDRFTAVIAEFRVVPSAFNMDDFLAEWGLEIPQNLIVDRRCDRIQIQAVRGAYRMINVIEYPYFPLVIDLDRQHPATKGLDAVSMPFVSPVQIKERKAGITYTPLGRTSDLSFLDLKPSFLNPLEEKMTPPNAVMGPFNAAVLAEGTVGEGGKPARLVVFGTSRFIQSDYPSRQTNLNLFVNLLDWSVQDEALIQIRSKGFDRRPLRAMSDGVRAILKYAMIAFMPLFSLAVGLIAWRRQKTRRALLPLSYPA